MVKQVLISTTATSGQRRASTPPPKKNRTIVIGLDTMSQLHAVNDINLLVNVKVNPVGIDVQGVGNVHCDTYGTLRFTMEATDGSVVLCNIRGVLYIPGLPHNALCYTAMTANRRFLTADDKHAYATTMFDDAKIIHMKTKDRLILVKANIIRDKKLYHELRKGLEPCSFLNFKEILIEEATCMVSRFAGKSVSYAYAHSVLGHPSKRIMDKIRTRKLLRDFSFAECDDTHERCLPCGIKNARRPDRKTKGNIETAAGAVVYSDLETVSVETYWGGKYAVLFVDSYSRFAVVYILKRKRHVVDALKLYLNVGRVVSR